MNLAELAEKQSARIRDERERNRARFPEAAADLDFLRANGFPNASIAWAQNAQGETIGKRDAGPWAEYRNDGQWGATQARVRKARTA